MLREGLPLQGLDKGGHKGGQTRHDLVEALGGDLTFLQQLVFANGISGFHASAPSGTPSLCQSHRRDAYTMT
jgi:hypothetical protein